jgi:hypothetical protein
MAGADESASDDVFDRSAGRDTTAVFNCVGSVEARSVWSAAAWRRCRSCWLT